MPALFVKSLSRLALCLGLMGLVAIASLQHLRGHQAGEYVEAGHLAAAYGVVPSDLCDPSDGSPHCPLCVLAQAGANTAPNAAPAPLDSFQLEAFSGAEFPRLVQPNPTTHGIRAPPSLV
ncbi:MAG: hypothetical protein AAGO57_03290 [Pseudomonadota bacterium]